MGSKRFWFKKEVGPKTKFWIKKNVRPKRNFESKKILVPKKLEKSGSGKNLDQSEKI